MKKLVRDLIPKIIRDSGRSPAVYVADREEHISRLYDKMGEELQEFIEDPCVEEAADIYEVFLSICKMHGIGHWEVLIAAMGKKNRRGAFDEGYVLEYVKED
jgi:predicted house-cleaning noncanonical NTP pyrophosphatase (MazG superfamily)